MKLFKVIAVFFLSVLLFFNSALFSILYNYKTQDINFKNNTLITGNINNNLSFITIDVKEKCTVFKSHFFVDDNLLLANFILKNQTINNISNTNNFLLDEKIEALTKAINLNFSVNLFSKNQPQTKKINLIECLEKLFLTVHLTVYNNYPTLVSHNFKKNIFLSYSPICLGIETPPPELSLV